MKFSSTGTFITQWASETSTSPWGVSVDSCDLVYVADDFGSALHKYTSSGTLIADFGSIVGQPYQYLGTIGVALDGSVYAAINNNQVIKYGSCTAFAVTNVNIINSPVHSHMSRNFTPSSTPTPPILAMALPVATTTPSATAVPTLMPTLIPTVAPTVVPALVPTPIPTVVAAVVVPTLAPAIAPTAVPTSIPTAVATLAPSVAPTAEPTLAPTIAPTAVPTPVPTAIPTQIPTVVPTTSVPTAVATATSVATLAPTNTPVPALTMTGVGASPNPFSPHSGQSTTISFTLNKAATVSISVYDKQNRLVRQWTGLSVQAGSGSQVWDGKDSGGQDVPPGLQGYRVEIVATAGAEIAQRTVSISVNP
jgi:hypothetical protein